MSLIMRLIINEELNAISGGAFKFTASIFNALSRTINTILDMGRTVGTSIRMYVTKKRCS